MPCHLFFPNHLHIVFFSPWLAILPPLVVTFCYLPFVKLTKDADIAMNVFFDDLQNIFMFVTMSYTTLLILVTLSCCDYNLALISTTSYKNHTFATFVHPSFQCFLRHVMSTLDVLHCGSDIRKNIGFLQ